MFLVGTLGLGVAPGGAQEEPTLAVDTSANFSVRPDDGRVEVRFTYRFTNPTDDVAFPGFFESLPADAVEVVASDGSTTLPAAPLGERDGFEVWLVAFAAPLDPGDELTATLDWVITDGPGESLPLVEAGAVVFDAYVPGPAGSTWQPATIEVPEGFAPVGPTGAAGTINDDGRVVYSAGTEAPYQPVTASLVDRDRFTSGSVDAPPVLTVADWRPEGDWLSTVLERGFEIVPTLDTWFGPRLEPIEMRRGLRGDAHPELALDDDVPFVVVAGASASATDHQLAHAWLAEVPTDEEWFVEGLAAAFAGDAPVAAPGAEIVGPLADEIGPTGVRAVVDALRGSEITYPGILAESQPLPPDWRTLLDLFEGVGGAVDAASLFRAAVVDDDGAALLDRRAAARIDYAALDERAGVWTLPPLLRLPMAEWDFDTFSARQGDVSDTLLRRDGVEGWADALGLDRRIDAQELFEAASSGTAEVDELLGEQEEALEAFDEAERLVNGDRGLLARVGLLRSDPDGDLVRLREMWAAGDYAGVTRRSHDLADLVEGAVGVGTIRLLVPIVFVVAAWQLLRWFIRRTSRDDQVAAV